MPSSVNLIALCLDTSIPDPASFESTSCAYFANYVRFRFVRDDASMRLGQDCIKCMLRVQSSDACTTFFSRSLGVFQALKVDLILMSVLHVRIMMPRLRQQRTSHG